MNDAWRVHGGSWYNLDQLCSSSMQGWVVAVVKEDLRAKNPGFGRLRQSRRLGLEPDLSSIDTHLQFLCIPHSHSSTPQKCDLYSRVRSLLCYFLCYVRCYKPPPLYTFSPFSLSTLCSTLDHLPSSSYLRTSRSDLILTNAVRFMVLKPSVAWLCFLSGAAWGMFLLS